MRVDRAWIAAAALMLGAWSEPSALAFCRTSTCPIPADFSPSAGSCVPSDFAQYCASLSTPVTPRPLWWRNACTSYDIQQNASKQVSYDLAVQSFDTAFAKWSGAACTGGGNPSIKAENLGAVACDEVHYNEAGTGLGNQHVIIFRDDGWPYPSDLNNTLGLTTMTFDPDTGEIYDADMEINTTVSLTVTGPVPSDGIDFLSIITHETGHFFGMAHSDDAQATMFAHYAPGSTSMRELTADDTAGICSIYRPGGERGVDPSVADGGTVMEDPCDPTPRHGFQSACAAPTRTSSSGGCAIAAASPAQSVRWLHVVAAALAAFALARRRPRRGIPLPSPLLPLAALARRRDLFLGISLASGVRRRNPHLPR
jgi:hypothetical protein